MARRSASNPRYQKHTSPAGKTRKSAAAAKPKRAAAEKPAAPKPSLAQRRYSMHPPLPAYRKMRLWWWVLLGTAIVLSTAAWALWTYTDQRQVGNYVLIASYALLLSAITLDWLKLRTLRQEWAAMSEADKNEAIAVAVAAQEAKQAKKAKKSDEPTDDSTGSSES